MKPDWKDAPEWANWLAMDGDGVWYWHEDFPSMSNFGVCFVSFGRKCSAMCSIGWKNSLEQKPEV